MVTSRESERRGCPPQSVLRPRAPTEVNVSLRNGVTSHNFTDWGIKKDPPGRTQSFFFFQMAHCPLPVN